MYRPIRSPLALRALVLSALGLGAPAPAAAADHFETFSYYHGDLHVHTGVSGDGGSADLEGTCVGSCGEMAAVYADAQARGLDFGTVTDHVNGGQAGTAEGFAAGVRLAAEANDGSGFVSLVGAELWLTTEAGDLGHKTLLLFGSDAQLGAVALTDVQPAGGPGTQVPDCEAVWGWAQRLQAAFGPLLLVPHHPAARLPMPTDWACHDPALEPVVEVYSEHGSSMGDGLGYDPLWSTEIAQGTVHAALDPTGWGHRMGFVGGSDKHDSRAGSVCALDTELPVHLYGGALTTVVLPATEALSREAIRQALLDRRTLATTGPTIPVAIAYASGGVPLGGLGAELGVPRGQPLDVRVAVPAELAGYVLGVDLVSPTTRRAALPAGGGVWTASLADGEREEWLYAALSVDGSLWYGSASCDDGGSSRTEYIWASPSWLAEVEPDLDGDGVAWLDGDCDDGDPARHPGAVEVPDDGVDQDCDGADAVAPVDTAEDTAPAPDTAEPEPQGQDSADVRHDRPTGPPDTGGCGCASTPRAGGLGLLALALAVVRRRR